jgi:S-adenosylmethionine-dependent methyltransferase
VKSVERFYDKYARLEWERHGQQRMEFAVTMRALTDHMPKAPARILDAGGGPGRYAIALAQSGHMVTLLDLSRECLDFARRKAAEASVEIGGYVQGNATRIDLPDESYDAVMLLGPMYHLLKAEERRKGLSEAKRVLVEGGTVFASFITRYSAVRDAAKRRPGLIVEDPGWLKEIIETGRLRPLPEQGYLGFTDAYLVEPREVVPFMEEAGFETVALLCCEGVTSMIDEKVNELEGGAWQAWVDLNYRLGKDPSAHGGAEHLLYVGAKSKA